MSSSFTVEDSAYMAKALRLAEQGLYTTKPNPCVGCLIVKDGRVVGEGWHRYAGGPHAEITALAMAGETARGATAYVTLEPCCHYGKTPPCTEALIAAGIVRVVAAMEDPHPKVAGKGMKQLTGAGVHTDCGLLQESAEAINQGFYKRMRMGLPYIRSKLAMSLDGRTAMFSGESRWITGPDARADVHRLRARSSAIVTGIDTVIADDPELTVRLGQSAGEIVQPMRVVLDSSCRLPSTAQLCHGTSRTVLLIGSVPSPSQQRVLKNIEIVQLPTGRDGRLHLTSVVDWLVSQECNEVLIEAGSTLNSSFLRENLVDEWIFYLAPVILGDQSRGLFHLPEVTRMADRYQLEWVDVCSIGTDLRMRFAKRPCCEKSHFS